MVVGGQLLKEQIVWGGGGGVCMLFRQHLKDPLQSLEFLKIVGKCGMTIIVLPFTVRLWIYPTHVWPQ
jgi:membrane protein insertase Oxa1/YidC/SpoIIIJ